MISYPISLPYPSSKKPAKLTLHQVNQTAFTASPFSGVQNLYKHQAEYWRGELQMPTMDRVQGSIWVAALARLRGRYGTFYLPVFGHETARGNPSGSPEAAGAINNGWTLQTQNWPASTNDVLKAGDYITINNQLLMNLEPVDSDASGDADIEIWPRYRGSIGTPLAITYSDPYGVFRLKEDMSFYEIDRAIHYRLGFEVVEAF